MGLGGLWRCRESCLWVVSISLNLPANFLLISAHLPFLITPIQRCFWFSFLCSIETDVFEVTCLSAEKSDGDSFHMNSCKWKLASGTYLFGSLAGFQLYLPAPVPHFPLPLHLTAHSIFWMMLWWCSGFSSPLFLFPFSWRMMAKNMGSSICTLSQ